MMNIRTAASDSKIFIVAGEESGDSHGADLVKAIRSRKPDITFIGIGGKKMEREGVEIISPAERISVVGIVEVLEKAPALLRTYFKAKRIVTGRKISAAVFIDFPDFNLRLARTAKKAGLPVFYYISPQVWAWRRRRIHTISRLVDRMLVILPFEERFYREHGVEVEYVGHPLADRMKGLAGEHSGGWEAKSPVIGLMPGSREGEVSAMLPHMLNAGKIMKKKLPGARFLLLLARNVGHKTAIKLIEASGLLVEINTGPDYRLMAGLDFLIVASGTATLEAGLLRIPMVIIYRGHLLSWLITKPLIKVPHIGLPNLIAGRRIVPELRQYEASGKRIAREAFKILTNREQYSRTKDDLKQMASLMGSENAARNAADAILSRL